MKNWLTLEADEVRLMQKHYTPGRGGHKIEMVVIHHNAGVLSIYDIWRVWQDRPASAHFQVETGGRIGQLVWDRDTAHHAANWSINQRSIGIEIANSAGANQDWPISVKAIEEAAHLTAAVCRFYQLGRPQAGKNVRFHREFASTSCPHHLAPGGKYFSVFMKRAQYWFDQMTAAPATSSGVITVSQIEQIQRQIDAAEARLYKKVTDFIAGFVGPIGVDAKDIRQQLTGGRDVIYKNGRVDLAASFPGWEKILGVNAEGKALTVTDAIGALRRDSARQLAILEQIAAGNQEKK